MSSFLVDGKKSNCSGCEACAQICPKNAISMLEDNEGFRYPVIDSKKCIKCGLCKKVCNYENNIKKHSEKQVAFGGYHNDWLVREDSTSGGAFSALVNSFCDKNYVIFGATSKGLKVYHTYITDKKKLSTFRKSKYLQSKIGDSYKQVKAFLNEGKKVLFSGTPCQIAGLRNYLMNANTELLLTIEVVCEGVPTPKYVEKMDKYLESKYNSKIDSLDYRYKDPKGKNKAKWDFQVMKITFQNGKAIKKDRWFNPFWNIWLNHLMSRPSCYSCPFTTKERVSDITLGDLWGVHIYCPELYGHNGGSSLIVANTIKGQKVLKNAQKYFIGHELDIDEAIKYQSPMRKSISSNDRRDEFMQDVTDDNMKYKDIIKKWYEKPKLRLLYQKYIYGNRQKVFLWNLKNKGRENNGEND